MKRFQWEGRKGRAGGVYSEVAAAVRRADGRMMKKGREGRRENVAAAEAAEGEGLHLPCQVPPPPPPC